MERHEMAEKLVEKCGISYEEAGEVLREANDDLLEAMIILERRGKLGSSQAKYSTGIMQNYHSTSEKTAFDAENIKEFLHIAWTKFCEVLKDILKYFVIIYRCGEEILKIPMIAAIVLVCVFNYLIVPAIIIGLVLEMRLAVKKDE